MDQMTDTERDYGLNVVELEKALVMVAQGYTYGEVAIRLGVQYWRVSGSIRKLPLAVTSDEKESLEQYANELGVTPGDILLDLYHVHIKTYMKNARKRKAA